MVAAIMVLGTSSCAAMFGLSALGKQMALFKYKPMRDTRLRYMEKIPDEHIIVRA